MEFLRGLSHDDHLFKALSLVEDVHVVALLLVHNQLVSNAYRLLEFLTAYFHGQLPLQFKNVITHPQQYVDILSDRLHALEILQFKSLEPLHLDIFQRLAGVFVDGSVSDRILFLQVVKGPVQSC